MMVWRHNVRIFHQKRLQRASVIKYRIHTSPMAWQWVIFFCDMSYFFSINWSNAFNRLKIAIYTCKKRFRKTYFQINIFLKNYLAEEIMWIIGERTGRNILFLHVSTFTCAVYIKVLVLRVKTKCNICKSIEWTGI